MGFLIRTAATAITFAVVAYLLPAISYGGEITTRIIVSPADRTQQTALALGRKFKTSDDVAPGASTASVLAAAGWPDAREPVLVVGHQPTLGEVAAFLLSGEEAAWSIRKGAVWWFSNRTRLGQPGVLLKVAIGPDLV